MKHLYIVFGLTIFFGGMQYVTILLGGDGPATNEFQNLMQLLSVFVLFLVWPILIGYALMATFSMARATSATALAKKYDVTVVSESVDSRIKRFAHITSLFFAVYIAAALLAEFPGPVRFLFLNERGFWPDYFDFVVFCFSVSVWFFTKSKKEK